MALTDSQALRDLLAVLLPGIHIDATVLKSGQRLVYFCHFPPGCNSPSDWSSWREVVLKVSQDIHPTIIARLEKERDILNEMNSPYFPKLYYYDVFSENPETDSKLPFRLFATIEERIQGGPLTGCTARFNAEPKVVWLLRHLVCALTLLWSNTRRIVHRDLKPDNIIIRTDDTPVVIDLGIVREEGTAGVTDTSWNIGPCTPGYASPEQLRNDKMAINFRSDVFSLGVLAYELMCSRNPFRHYPDEPHHVVIHRTLNDELEPLREKHTCSDRFSNLIHSMTEKDAYKRPRTWKQLREELDAISGGALA
jgi:eukaryotic-like serine/threonine-protein kinase